MCIDIILEKYILEYNKHAEDSSIEVGGDKMSIEIKRSGLEEIRIFLLDVLKLPAILIDKIVERVIKRFKFIATKEGRKCTAGTELENELCYLKMRLIKKQAQIEILQQVESEIRLTGMAKYRQYLKKAEINTEIRQLKESIAYWTYRMQDDPNWNPDKDARLVSLKHNKNKEDGTYEYR